jgi:hypothetical protein
VQKKTPALGGGRSHHPGQFLGKAVMADSITYLKKYYRFYKGESTKKT